MDVTWARLATTTVALNQQDQRLALVGRGYLNVAYGQRPYRLPLRLRLCAARLSGGLSWALNWDWLEHKAASRIMLL